MLPFRRKKQQQQDPSPLTVEARREWAHRHAADQSTNPRAPGGRAKDDLWRAFADPRPTRWEHFPDDHPWIARLMVWACLAAGGFLIGLTLFAWWWGPC